MDSLVGNLLVAVPDLPDENFYRSVVLVIQHTSEGATGVILNRPSNLTVAEVWSQFSELPCESQQVVNVGGPVDGPLLALHTSLAVADAQVIPGVYLTLSSENLNKLVGQLKQQFRIYCGYAGWGPGQLDTEVQCGGWLTFPAEFDHVFGPPELLWKKVCELVGNDVMLRNLTVHQSPGDPSLN